LKKFASQYHTLPSAVFISENFLVATAAQTLAILPAISLQKYIIDDPLIHA